MQGVDINTIAILLNSIVGLATLVFIYYTRKDVEAVHAATNSIHELSLKNAAAAAHAEGAAEERVLGEQKAAVIQAKQEGLDTAQSVEITKSIPLEVKETTIDKS